MVNNYLHLTAINLDTSCLIQSITSFYLDANVQTRQTVPFFLLNLSYDKASDHTWQLWFRPHIHRPIIQFYSLFQLDNETTRLLRFSVLEWSCFPGFTVYTEEPKVMPLGGCYKFVLLYSHHGGQGHTTVWQLKTLLTLSAVCTCKYIWKHSR